MKKKKYYLKKTCRNNVAASFLHEQNETQSVCRQINVFLFLTKSVQIYGKTL